MSVTCGFYNSLNGDRKYNAEQMSSLFDGIIRDGVFSTVGTCMMVNALTGFSITVGIGRAWFNHTWTDNDAILPIVATEPDILLDRIDAVVLEVNATDEVRENIIKIVEGTPGVTPEKPEMTRSEDVNQYALAYITRAAGSTEIRQADIENMVGTDDTPFITGPLEILDINVLLPKWKDQLNKFVEDMEKYLTEETARIREELLGEASELGEWTKNYKANFLEWYASMKGKLSEDAAGNIQNEIDRDNIHSWLIHGFVDGTKVFTNNGLTITSTDSEGRKLIKEITEDMSQIKTTLLSSEGLLTATLTKTFDEQGNVTAVVENIV